MTRRFLRHLPTAAALMLAATAASAEISVTADAVNPKEMTTEQTQFLNSRVFAKDGNDGGGGHWRAD